MLYIRGNSLSKSTTSNFHPSVNPRLFQRLHSEEISTNQIQNPSRLKNSLHKPSISLSILPKNSEKVIFSIRSSRLQKSLSMKTQLIQLNKKYQNNKQIVIHS